ncbi:VOC family protein [Streptomyces sp. NPDC005827]|uniref:VOC family protein n=1 Tax=Streptomyces sp. NPDC005827 TaxID=3157070 RepID=UPI0033F22FBE
MSARPVARGLHHIGIPVSELERTTAWYRSVLSARRLAEFGHVTQDGQLFAVIPDVPGADVPVELRLDPATAGRRAGFDPPTLTVTDRAEPDGWIRHHDTPDVPPHTGHRRPGRPSPGGSRPRRCPASAPHRRAPRTGHRTP